LDVDGGFAGSRRAADAFDFYERFPRDVPDGEAEGAKGFDHDNAVVAECRVMKTGAAAGEGGGNESAVGVALRAGRANDSPDGGNGLDFEDVCCHGFVI